MKKLLIYGLCMFSFVLLLTGCQNNNRSEDDLTDLQNNVDDQLGDHFTYSRDELKDALNYIHHHLDDIKDEEVAKKIYEKAYYIEAVSKKSNQKIDNEVTQYAIKAKDYAKNVYLANDNDRDNIIEKGKDDLVDLKDKFETGMDSLIDQFSQFFKK